MLELTIYGLTGLAAMLVVAFFFAYADDFAPAREKPSFGRRKNRYLNDSRMIEIGTGNPPVWGTVGNQQESTRICEHSPAETGPAAIHSISFQSNRGQREASHG
jgi:hypothetical protein